MLGWVLLIVSALALGWFTNVMSDARIHTLPRRDQKITLVVLAAWAAVIGYALFTGIFTGAVA